MKVKQDLNTTIHEKYGQPKEEGITKAIDATQIYFKCCGSAGYEDWQYSKYYLAARYVPKSCCKADKRSDAKCVEDAANLNREVGCVTFT